MEAIELFSELLSIFRKMSKEHYGCSLRAYKDSFNVTVYEDFKAVSTFIKTMKSIQKDGTIQSESVYISVTLNTKDEPYIVINCYDRRSCSISFYNGKEQLNSYQEYTHYKPLMFFSRDKMYSKNCKSRWIPANLKSFGHLPKILREMIFTFLSRHNPLWKDFLPYEQLPPFPIDLINNSHNIRELLEKKFKVSLPKSVNRKPLDAMYAACCAMKYVPEKQKNILFSTCVHGVSIKEKSKEIAKKYINSVILERLNVNGKTHEIQIINDYVQMAFLGKKKVEISLLLGRKGYRQLHDEYMTKYRLSQSKIKLKIPNTQLSKIKLPEDFTRISTNKALVTESVHNSNCVWSYVEKINKGKCLIYTLDYNNEHCTIEIVYRRSKYCVNQLRKSYDRRVSAEAEMYIQNAVKAANGR